MTHESENSKQDGASSRNFVVDLSIDANRTNQVKRSNTLKSPD